MTLGTEDQQTRQLRSKVSYDKNICFICNEKKNNDELPYNGGGQADAPIAAQKQEFLTRKRATYRKNPIPFIVLLVG